MSELLIGCDGCRGCSGGNGFVNQLNLPAGRQVQLNQPNQLKNRLCKICIEFIGGRLAGGGFGIHKVCCFGAAVYRCC
jgi:hypothetical protein